MELFLEGSTDGYAIAHSVLKCTVVARFEALQIRQEWSRAAHPKLVLDGAEDAVDGDLERSEVSINSEDLTRGFREELGWERFL